MTGSNSNTNGSSVGNIGFWPRSILPSIIAKLESSINSLKGLLAGTVLPAAVDFSEKAKDDRIADVTMEEIARRLIVTFEKTEEGNILYQSQSPEDHTKLWAQTDPVTNFPIGRIKQWDAESGTWVDTDPSSAPFVAPLKRNGRLISPEGASTQNFQFEDIKTDDYRVILTPTTFAPASNTWASSPGSLPNSWGFVVTNKTNTMCSVAFFGIPEDGLTWEIDIEDRQTTA